ncbi:BBT_HP_G0133380.mRNA.1.CDS.1 [Saccharomyces cerevisiae]|nr:BBT_HP_G0133380.mRNA.1.CDS.1 [Saccharomyces cerevisiae]CAI6977047.1 BBT_HP_G0133380.mRNA.1.CDS.1 [Saccharomyces cerevisiae]
MIFANGTPIEHYIDSHHDDVTCIKFHPSDVNILLSGSTDGYTNIYDLKQDEEEGTLTPSQIMRQYIPVDG